MLGSDWVLLKYALRRIQSSYVQFVLKFMPRKKFRFFSDFWLTQLNYQQRTANSAPFRHPSIVVASVTVPGGLENDFDFDFDARGEETE